MTTPLPNFNDFVNNFFYSATGIPQAAIAPTSPILLTAYNVAVALINLQIEFACYQGANLLYQLAVYNLAAHNVIMYAPDLPGGPTVPNPSPGGDGVPTQVGYFAGLRQTYGFNSFMAGTVSASSDEGSSVSIATSSTLEGLTVQQLGLLRTPYGQTALGFMQSVGSLWGLS